MRYALAFLVLCLVALALSAGTIQDPPRITVWHASDASSGAPVELVDGLGVFFSEEDRSELSVRAPDGFIPRAALLDLEPGQIDSIGYEVRGTMFKPESFVFATWSEAGGDFELQPDGSLEGEAQAWDDQAGVEGIEFELWVVAELSDGTTVEESRGVFFEADWSSP